MSENENENEGRRPRQDFVRAELRLPPDLHNRLRELAALDGRSLHSYILRVLRAHAASQGGRP